MLLEIFNTFSGEKENFFPLMESDVGINVCGAVPIAELDEKRILLEDIPGGTEWKVK